MASSVRRVHRAGRRRPWRQLLPCLAVGDARPRCRESFAAAGFRLMTRPSTSKTTIPACICSIAVRRAAGSGSRMWKPNSAMAYVVQGKTMTRTDKSRVDNAGRRALSSKNTARLSDLSEQHQRHRPAMLRRADEQPEEDSRIEQKQGQPVGHQQSASWRIGQHNRTIGPDFQPAPDELRIADQGHEQAQEGRNGQQKYSCDGLASVRDRRSPGRSRSQGWCQQ